MHEDGGRVERCKDAVEQSQNNCVHTPVLHCICKHDWNGNVRKKRNINAKCSPRLTGGREDILTESKRVRQIYGDIRRPKEEERHRSTKGITRERESE